ncbi:hypothetical protein V5799_025469 [Amblyomma americanum]|uniref:MADF domain-containing protein n=1 Tax=Amblyomma americanum TaxID=6943 RepID=A0AAQ4E9G5_AMBAM
MCSWDRHHPDYADDSKRRRALNVIAGSLDNELDVPDLVKKIQLLREQYAKELKKESQRRSTRHFIYRWVHLERMAFLRSAVTADEREQARGDVPLLDPERGVPSVCPEAPDNKAANTVRTPESNLSSYAGEQTSMSVMFLYTVKREPEEALSVAHIKCSPEGRHPEVPDNEVENTARTP